MLAAAAAVHRGPEIVQHMAMEADPLAGLEPDDPDADLVGLRQQLGADAAVVLAAFALEFGLDLGRPFAAVLVRRPSCPAWSEPWHSSNGCWHNIADFSDGKNGQRHRNSGRRRAIVIGGSMSGLFAGLHAAPARLRGRHLRAGRERAVRPRRRHRRAAGGGRDAARARHRHRRSRRRDDHAQDPRCRRPHRLRDRMPADADRLGAALSHPARRLSGRALSPRRRA